MGLFEMAYSNIYKAHTTLKTSCVPCNVDDLSQILRLQFQICNDESLSLLLTIKSVLQSLPLGFIQLPFSVKFR